MKATTNFERALTIDESDSDMLNEYGILLTKRAQRVLKLVRAEEEARLDKQPEASVQSAPAREASHDGAGKPDRVPDDRPSDTEEGVSQDEAQRRARRAQLMAQVDRYFDAAEAKFMELERNMVWFGAINLACLAALRGREDDAKRWLYTCRDRHDLAPEHLEDRFVSLLRRHSAQLVKFAREHLIGQGGRFVWAGTSTLTERTIGLWSWGHS